MMDRVSAPPLAKVVGSVPVEDASQLSYDRFCLDYLRPNLPVIIRGVTMGWRACAEWQTEDGLPALDALRQNFGSSLVQVAVCDEQRFTDQLREEMTVAQFLDECEWQAPQGRGQSHGGNGVGSTMQAVQWHEGGMQARGREDEEVHSGSRQCGDVRSCGETRQEGGLRGREERRRGDSGKEGAKKREEAGRRGEGGEAGGAQREGHSRLLYLKDWHFVQDHPSYRLYTTPAYFDDDWLNIYADARTRRQQQQQQQQQQLKVDQKAGIGSSVPDWGGAGSDSETHNQAVAEGVGEEGREGEGGGAPGGGARGSPQCFSDYRFVYIGPAGTWTPLHCDVLRSFSWSVNVCGRKRWLMLPPNQAHKVKHRHNNSTVYDIDQPVDATAFPHFSETTWLVAYQEPGDAIFVPSAWHHQVTNLADTVSINHNWVNAANIHHMWSLLLSDRQQACAAISDLWHDVTAGHMTAGEFHHLVQRNLRANSGMNFDDFLHFLRFFVHRAAHTVDGDATSSSHQWLRDEECAWERGNVDFGAAACGGPISQALFDLDKLNKVLIEMAEDEWFQAQKNLEEICAQGLNSSTKAHCPWCDVPVGKLKRSECKDTSVGISKRGVGFKAYACQSRPQCLSYLCQLIIDVAQQ